MIDVVKKNILNKIHLYQAPFLTYGKGCVMIYLINISSLNLKNNSIGAIWCCLEQIISMVLEKRHKTEKLIFAIIRSSPSVPVAVTEIQNQIQKNLRGATHASSLVISRDA